MRQVDSAVGIAALLGMALLQASGGHARAAVTAAEPAEPVASVWQHHKTSFTYSGFTSAYTCDGLADRVRLMLGLLGARKDMTVIAGSCPGGPDTPSHMIIVEVEFYALAPAAAESATAAADAASTVNAQWTALKVVPHSPGFMSDGDCELVQSMKDFIGKNFALRGVEYRTSCFPNTVSMDSYALKGQVLKLPAAARAAKS